LVGKALVYQGAVFGTHVQFSIYTRRIEMRRLLSVLLLLLPLLAVASVATASPTSRPGVSAVYTTTLSGDEEVPARDTKAHGVATFRISADGQSAEYMVIANNIENVAAGHIHTGTLGINGPVVVNLVSPTACEVVNNGIRCRGSFTAADFVGPLAGQPFSALLELLEQERAYVNVHTAQFPGGEIRGQID